MKQGTVNLSKSLINHFHGETEIDHVKYQDIGFWSELPSTKPHHKDSIRLNKEVKTQGDKTHRRLTQTAVGVFCVYITNYLHFFTMFLSF